MKVTPITTSSAQVGAAIASNGSGRTSADRIAMAKAIAAGQKPFTLTQSDTPVDPNLIQQKQNTRRITMRTQASPDRQEAAPQVEPPREESAGNEEPTLAHPNQDEQPAPPVEATQPLGPQYAALVRQKRALQEERREFESLKREMEGKQAASSLEARLLADPLSVLQEKGLLDTLTASLMTQPKVEANPEVEALKAKIAELEKGVETKFSERDVQQKQQVLAEMTREAESLVAKDANFELVKATSSVKDAISLIDRVYEEKGIILDVSEALTEIENQLLEDNLKLAQSSKKIQEKLGTGQAPGTPQQQQPQQRFRTLTAKDGSQPLLSRRARALAAFHGTLGKQ